MRQEDLLPADSDDWPEDRIAAKGERLYRQDDVFVSK